MLLLPVITVIPGNLPTWYISKLCLNCTSCLSIDYRKSLDADLWDTAFRPCGKPNKLVK